MQSFSRLLIFAMLLFSISSCSDNEQINTEIKPGFEKYVSGFTSGATLSRSSRFVIRFQQSVNDSAQAGQEVVGDAFEFNPSIKGKTLWINSRSMEFIPDELLESGEVYRIRFHVANFMEVPDEFALLEYEVRTLEQSYRFVNKGLSTYEKNMVLLKYEGDIISADLANSKQIEEMVEASLEDEGLKLKWTHDAGSKVHHFVIDSIERKDDSQSLEIDISGDPIGVDQNDDLNQRIPGLNEFEVLNVQAFAEKSQYVLIQFSDPLEQEQNLKGLIYFESDHYPDFVIEGSKVKVFTSKKLTKEQKLHIAPGIKNALGYKFKTETIFPISFESNKPAVETLSQGVIIPSSKGLIFPFRAVSLNMVDLSIVKIYEDNVLDFLQDNDLNTSYDIKMAGRLIVQKRLDLNKMTRANLNQWNTFKIDIADYIKVEPGAIYRVSIGFRMSYSAYPCESNKEALQTDEEYAIEVAKNMKRWDSKSYYYDYYSSGFNYRERDNPCHITYYSSYYNSRSIEQNLIASNLGIIAKGTPNNKYAIAVSNISSTDPIKGAKVIFYNLQKQPITESKTNKLGICIEQLVSKPYFVVVQDGDDYGYLKLDNGNALSMSNFNVSGMHIQEGLKAYIYGERDVWRPGDHIYLTLILDDLENRLPADHPVVFDLINPLGQTMVHEVKKSNVNGFYSLHTQTDATALTGNWTARIKVGGAEFSRRIRIETIKPNRIKASLGLDMKLLTKERLRSPISIEAKWLHGSPAKNLKTKIFMTLRPASTTFKKFEKYHFLFPKSQYKTEESEVFSGTLDDEGKTIFNLRIAAYEAPGMLNANFITRVFEKSGEFSIITKSIKYSPFESYVGIKMDSDGQNGWYQTDTKYSVNIVSVDEFGKPVVRKNLKVKLYKISWRWWWNSYNDNLASYLGRNSKQTISTQYINTDANGKGSFDIQINYRNYDDNGRYLLVAEDPKSGHKTGMTVYFSKWYGRLGGGGEGANMLSFNSDKDKYKVGEEVNISIPSSKNGRALVSLESGSDIVDLFWVETQENETRFSFPITKEMAPNVFVHISLIQPHAQTLNDNPIRMYGVIPIEVEDPETKLSPKIGVAKSFEPEKEFVVKISEEQGNAMTYTLAIVDEGLLDITNFKTPDPWRRFYAPEALGVRTWDLYDYVIGAYGARLEKAFAIGGDGSAPDPSKNKANRFTPVVIFAGPFTLDKGETQKHKFTMPNYIGSVRIMVIAGNQGAYGNAEKAVPVKKDLMLLATLPRVLSPDEEVVLPVTIFAMSKNVKEVKIKLRTNDKLKIISSSETSAHFTKNGDQVVYFRLKVNKKLGIAKAHIEASSGNLKAHYDIELDVRTPNPSSIIIKDSLLESGKQWQAQYHSMGIDGTNSAVLEISGIPAMGLDWRLEQLLAYPHGCIEQTTSKIFPQLFLSDLTSLSDEERIMLEQNVMAGINSLRGFQLYDGAFSYWPGSIHASEWGTSYAGHMMLVAEQKGYHLPSRMKSQWLQFQRTTARTWTKSRFYGNQLNQAYRLYTLALAEKADLGAMNRLSQSSGLNERSRYMLALAYAQVGQRKMAHKLLAMMPQTQPKGRWIYLNDYSYGSQIRDEAIQLLLLTKLDEREKAFTFVKRISAKLDRRSWLSTQSVAFSLMAVSQYYDGHKPESIKFSMTWKGEKKSFDSHEFIYSKKLDIKNQNGKTLKIENLSTGALYVRLIQKGIPSQGKEENRSDNLQMKVTYTDMDGNALDPSRLEQGTDFKAIVEVKNPGILGNYQNMSLTQIFPSGWEITNTRLLGMSSSSSPASYIDIRDDRVFTYFDLRKYKSAHYIVLLNASYEGKYYLPAVKCEAMYENSIGAVQKGRWVEVVRD